MKTIGPACELGEGPLWHPERERLYWFDITVGTMHVCNALGGQHQSWQFGEPASAAGWVDHDTLIVATASGFQKFDILSGQWTTLAGLEADNAATRSNDGRIGPDGSFWIGTMDMKAAYRAGAYYRYAQREVLTLFDQVTIPNATCFSPDGSIAYLADTAQQVIWRWDLDANGAPIGNRQVHINLHDENLNPDGAVCDAEGYLWNAQWGASRLARYAPDGRFDKAIDLPVSQPTCPAFGGPDLTTLYVTSARQGLSDAALELEPHAGKIIVIDVDVPGLREHQARL